MIFLNYWWALALTPFQIAAACWLRWRGLLVTSAAGVALIWLGFGFYVVYFRYTCMSGTAACDYPVFTAIEVLVVATSAAVITFVLIGTMLPVWELLTAEAGNRRDIFASGRTSFFLAIWCYVILSMIVFGDILRPIKLLSFFIGRLSPEYWTGPLIGALIIGSLAARESVAGTRGAVFVACSMMTGLGLTWIVIDAARAKEIRRFGPAGVCSLFDSIRNSSPFFLHGYAYKNGKSYGWSYSEMRFYELPPNVAKNVSLNCRRY